MAKKTTEMTSAELKAESARLLDLVEPAMANRKPEDPIAPWVDARLKQAQVLATLATVK